MTRRQQGYSLYELTVTTLVVAILLSLGVPSFSTMMARNRQRVEVDALFHAIHLARKESIMRRKVVSLCPSQDGSQCAPGKDWSMGWIMFENADRDSPPHVDEGEVLLQHHQVPGNVIIVANRKGFTLRSVYLRATNGTFIICDPVGRVPARALVVSYTGRPRVASSKTDGEPYSCAD